jgi:4-amino-4-deoxychorismate lyase
MILVNGEPADTVAASDRGLAYGDGAFRTLLVHEGKPRCWKRHYRKLAHDCTALEIPCPAGELLAADLERATRRLSDSVVKIIVTRGSGTRGYAPPRPATSTRVVMASALPQHPAEFLRSGVALHLCRTRLALQPRLAGVKHLNRLENVLARAEWDDASVPEGLMLDADGNAIGGTMTNLFIVEGSDLVTPDLSLCGVAGVTRERVMDAASARGAACREESTPLARVLNASEVLLVNSVIGVWQVRECAGRSWSPGAAAARVRQWLDECED